MSAAVKAEDVFITSELNLRKSREPNYAAESEAFFNLSAELANGSQSFLDKVVEYALKLCSAHSAGTSLLKIQNGKEVLGWEAVAGKMAKYRGLTIDLKDSPCGYVLKHDHVQLCQNPIRFFQSLSKLSEPVHEYLGVAIRYEKKTLGTLWVILHDTSRKFEDEDARILTALAHYMAVFLSTFENQTLLRSNEERLRGIFEYANVGFCTTDLEGHIEQVNPAFCEIVGYSKEELQKLDFYFITHPDDRAKKREDVRRMLAGEVPAFRAEKRYVCKDGSVVWVQNSLSLIRDPLGNPAHIVVVVQDITDEKMLQQALTMAKNQAEIANVAKSQFLANMSHEIRTPLGAILGFANLVKDPQLPTSDREKYLDIICRSGQALSQLVDDILDLSKIEMGHLQIEQVDFSLKHLVQDVLSLLSFKAKEKGISLVSKGEIPDMVASDPTRIRQILTNVIGNAVKFTTAGEVVVLMSHEKNQNGELISFYVNDTGPGMNAEQQARLFKPFTQADESMTRKYGGTGLGLELSRRLARALEGNIELVSSEVGKGSSFLIKVQVDEAQEQKQTTSSAAEIDLTGLKVLLVEDSIDNQLLIGYLLRKQGAQVECANNGAEGIERATEKHFDLVLMDIQMPNVDGYQATKTLRSKGYQKPIIALTAHALKEDRDRCLAMGCDAYLTKPINPVELNHAVSLHAQR